MAYSNGRRSVPTRKRNKSTWDGGVTLSVPDISCTSLRVAGVQVQATTVLTLTVSPDIHPWAVTPTPTIKITKDLSGVSTVTFPNVQDFWQHDDKVTWTNLLPVGFRPSESLAKIAPVMDQGNVETGGRVTIYSDGTVEFARPDDTEFITANGCGPLAQTIVFMTV